MGGGRISINPRLTIANRKENKMDERYILAYTIEQDEEYIDSYFVFEDLEDARAEYKNILELDGLYTASISKAIEGTDI